MADISQIKLPNGDLFNLKDKSRGLISVSETPPTDERVEAWIDPTEKLEIDLAEINDSVVSTNYTWSSQKIKKEIGSGGGGSVPDDVVTWAESEQGYVPPQATALYQDADYPELETTSKQVLSAINELVDRVKVMSQQEYDALSDVEPNTLYFTYGGD